jgi:transcriptional regulator with XRE-family HTH domain
MFKEDELMGNLIRRLRKASGMSQMQLADQIGVSYQQVQKYEKGVNRLSVSRLKQVSDALGVSVATFLDEIETPKVSDTHSRYSGLTSDEAKLLMLFRKLDSKKLKVKLVDIVEDMVKLSRK